jgi:type I restriction enzyme S subunit
VTGLALFEPEVSSHRWRGVPPLHWSLKRLKWSIFGHYNGIWGDEPDGENDIICIRVADFDRVRKLVVSAPPTVRAVGRGYREQRVLRKGDLLIEKSGGGDNQLVGCVVHFDHHFEAVCSNFVARVPLQGGMVSQYWSYVHSSIYSARLNFPAIKQTTGIQNLDAEAYFNIEVAFPPEQEQFVIANYLDRETARIDGLIAEKERMLALLLEKGAALISRAVTRGLDPNAPLTPSGQEWLGEIPAHWEILPIKYLATVGNGSTPSVENADYWDNEGYPWLNSSVVNVSPVTNVSRFVTETALRECHLPKVQPPAVLVGITGQGKTRGMAAVLGIEATINQHLAFIKPRTQDLDADFLCYLLGHAYAFLRSDSDGAGSTKGAITCEQLANLKIPVPPGSEQMEICERIRQSLDVSKPLRSEIQRSLDLLIERRSALITAAVTGQIPLEEMVR